MSQPTFLGSNISLVKAHNLRAILLNLLYEEGLSRVELAEHTSLSTTTITNLITELLEQGIVVEDGSDMPRDPRQIGRPRTGLRLVPDSGYAVGVHIGIGLLRVAVTNLRAEVICNRITNFALDCPPEAVVTQIGDEVELTIAESGIDRQRLIGLGVGASGLVDPKSGMNSLAPTLGWHEVPIRDQLKARLDLPVTVDNNVRAMALGEALFGAGRGADVLAFVYGRTGVGAGFVVGGRLFRGAGAGAGEIGHTIILPQGGDRCRCGSTGCLETLVSEVVLIRKAERLVAENPSGLLAEHWRQPGDAKPVDRIFAAARAGDEPTRAMVNQCGFYLGIALANLVNVLNPELILLGGMFAQGADLLLPVAEANMRERAFAGLGEKVRVATTSFGWRAGVIGASALALSSFFYQ